MEQLKHRNYCITINNYTAEQFETLKTIAPSKYKYIVIGKEVGESGTPHLQIYVEFKNPRSFKSVKKEFYNGHLELRKGTPIQASDYCKKEADFYEYGTIANPGKRNDIHAVKEAVKNGANMRDIIDTASSYQAMKSADLILKYYEISRTWKSKVIWLYGPTGSGKSKYAIEQCGDDYWISLETSKWFEGYDAHENVIFDDMRKDFCKFHVLLRLLDRYQFRIETKGGSRQFLAKNIYITTPYHPAEMYQTREDVKQLLRRIDKIYYCKDILTPPEDVSNDENVCTIRRVSNLEEIENDELPM